MSKIFISYRRTVVAHARAIREWLKHDLQQEYGFELMFMDVDSLQAGQSWAAVIPDSVKQCHLLLALITPSWLDEKDERSGARKLDTVDDPVVLEIGTAISERKHVIPVFLDGATVPLTEQLPERLRMLFAREAALVRMGKTFPQDMQILSASIRQLIGHPVLESRWLGTYNQSSPGQTWSMAMRLRIESSGLCSGEIDWTLLKVRGETVFSPYIGKTYSEDVIGKYDRKNRVVNVGTKDIRGGSIPDRLIMRISDLCLKIRDDDFCFSEHENHGWTSNGHVLVRVIEA